MELQRVDWPILLPRRQEYATCLHQSFQNSRNRLHLLSIPNQRHGHGLDKILARRLHLHSETPQSNNSREKTETEPERRRRPVSVHRVDGASHTWRKTRLHSHTAATEV